MDACLLSRVLSTLLSEATTLLHRRVILARCSGRCHLRMPAIHRGKVATIRMRHLHMVLLLSRCTNMVLPRKRSLLSRLTRLNPACAAIEARPVVDRRAVNHRIVDVRIVDHGPVHIDDCGVIRKAVADPAPSAKTDATITESIVHAAIEANVRPPVPSMKDICATAPAPVARRPQQTNLWRPNPHTRNPVVARITVRPVAGVPEIAISGANRLRINRQHRRCKTDRDKDPGKRCGWRNRESRTHNNLTN